MTGNGKRSLEEIFEEHLAVTKAGFDRVNQNIADTALALQTSMREELASAIDELRADMNKGFTRMEARFDNLLVTSGTRAADHEDRITALEADVAKLKAG